MTKKMNTPTYGRILLGLLLTLPAVQHVQAQEYAEYHPFVQDGKTWKCGYAEGGDDRSFSYYMTGDTIIDGTAYKKVYCANPRLYGDNTVHYFCAVREDAYKIYGLKADAMTEQMLYNFSLTDGGGVNYPAATVARGNAWRGYLRGEPRYCFDVHPSFKDSDEQPMYAYMWIEGIGSMEEPFPFELHPGKVMLSECLVGGRQVFELVDQFHVDDPSYHGTSGLKETGSPREVAATAYDLQGGAVRQGRHNVRLYIRDGRKYVGPLSMIHFQ
ncbi:MAG: hypothetical protein IJ551_01620 [Prevotella sp.]|nr:hypothetical protein [Prevotella sp.]